MFSFVSVSGQASGNRFSVLNCGWLKWPACSAVLTILVMGLFPLHSAAENPDLHLDLSRAIQLTAKNNPQLQAHNPRRKTLQARAMSVRQAPPLALALSVDNFAGSGATKDFSAAEMTLSLSSVIELGKKSQLRGASADAELARVGVVQELETLNLFGDLTRTFIHARGLEERLRLSDETINLAKDTLAVVERRADAGASPEAEIWRAKADLNRAMLAHTELVGQLENHKLTLAAFWGARSFNFANLSGELYQFAPADSFDSLYQRAITKPLIELYASEQRIRELELQSARAAGKSNVEWQLGVRHLQESDDNALVASFSVPLFTGSRNQSDVRASLAALEEVQYQKQHAELALHTRLLKAYRQRQINIQAVDHIRSNLIPALDKALAETLKAYEHGLYTYIDWSTAQRDLQAAKHLLLDAALSAHLSQTEIEQLSGESLSQVPDQNPSQAIPEITMNKGNSK